MLDEEGGLDPFRNGKNPMTFRDQDGDEQSLQWY